MIFLQLSQQLTALQNLIYSLNDKHYTHKIEHLGNASIGEHTRHIIELLQCVITGYFIGEIDYVNRTRNLELETNKVLAIQFLETFEKKINLADKQLLLTTENAETLVTTSYFREIVYNTEHTIHHLALIKVALIEMKLNVVDADFGMAYSTLKYKTFLQNA